MSNGSVSVKPGSCKITVSHVLVVGTKRILNSNAKVYLDIWIVEVIRIIRVVQATRY